MQHTSEIVMIRPVSFGFNPETAVNNRFQVNAGDTSVQENALAEFEAFVAVLRANKINVTVIDDTGAPHTPDSVFPNNWISFHDNGRAYLYPMFAPNRRLERKQHVLDAIRSGFELTQTIDLTGYEESGRYLEGTGSMVLDRDHAIAYACLSPRTDTEVLTRFCRNEAYQPVWFHARDRNGALIYHTNVMMCVADSYVVICLDCIHDPGERKHVTDTIRGTHKELITITEEQVNHFAGNMLQVHGTDQQPRLVMSTQAYRSLTPEQLRQLEHYNPIVHSDLSTIETNGGGSARCMMAEVFLTPRDNN